MLKKGAKCFEKFLMDKRCPIYLVINQRKKCNFGLVSISWGIPETYERRNLGIFYVRRFFDILYVLHVHVAQQDNVLHDYVDADTLD